MVPSVLYETIEKVPGSSKIIYNCSRIRVCISLIKYREKIIYSISLKMLSERRHGKRYSTQADKFCRHPSSHWLNMELDLQSLFELFCTAVLTGWDPATPPLPPHLGSKKEEDIGQPK